MDIIESILTDKPSMRPIHPLTLLMLPYTYSFTFPLPVDDWGL
jgi:hypothetical protein